MVNKIDNQLKQLISAPEAAHILGISRVAVFKKIKTGEIKAEKIGRNFVININDLGISKPAVLTESDKKKIDLGVDRVIKEYGETLRLLAKE
ncbi:MAG: helix-turn-helix domain-containing protein [Patescibacteria group bacterium]